MQTLTNLLWAAFVVNCQNGPFGMTGRTAASAIFFFFKQKTAYEISECDWSSDVCLPIRSEEHTSELQSHSEISYAVFCLKKKKARYQKYWVRDDIKRQERTKNTFRLKLFLLFFQCLGFHCIYFMFFFFFFNDTATTEIYTNLNTLSLHDALPICHIQKSRMPSSACDRSEERRVGKEC